MRHTASAAAAEYVAGVRADPSRTDGRVDPVSALSPRHDGAITMSNNSNRADAGEPIHDHPGDDRIDAFEMTDRTVLYDPEDADRWIQSDAAVDLAERA